MKPKLHYDPAAAVDHLRDRDDRLAILIDRIGPCTFELKPAGSLFAALLRSIVYQQLHAKAAASILGRVQTELKRQGGIKPATIGRTPDSALRGAGLSGNKLKAIRDLAAKCLDGTVPSLTKAAGLGDDELVSRLTTIRGIGPWTVHMLLIFHLGRPDVLPTGDYAIRLGFKRLYGKRREPSPEVMRRHARRWQPYRTVASWYLWRSLDAPD